MKSVIEAAAKRLERCAAVYERIAALKREEYSKTAQVRAAMTGAPVVEADEPMSTLVDEARLCRQDAAALRSALVPVG